MMDAKRLRIAWFSVLNTERSSAGESLSAYFTDCVLPFLQERFEIEVFHNSFEKYKGLPTFHYLQAAPRHAAYPYDIFFYQVEDKKENDFIRTHLGLIPGVVLFHDFVLSTDGPEPILNSPWQATLKKFQNLDLTWTDRGAQFLKEGQIAFREAGYTLVPLFSNSANCEQYKSLIRQRLAGDETPSPAYIPIPVTDFKESLSSMNTLQIAYCGTPFIKHRAHKLFPAIAKLDKPKKLHWLIAEDEVKRAEDLLNEFFGSAWQDFATLHLGRSPQRWRDIIKNCNVAAHPLFSVHGHPCPYLELSLAHNLPCLVTRFAYADTLPDALVYKIEAGVTEERQFFETLKHLEETLGCKRDLSTSARELFSASAVAQDLAFVFEKNAAYLKDISQRWIALQKNAGRALLEEVRQSVCIGVESCDLTGLSNPLSAWDTVFSPVMQELGWK